MSLRGFSKSLSAEIGNLFANLGDSNVPELRRLDKSAKERAALALESPTFDMDSLWERIKNLDIEERR